MICKSTQQIIDNLLRLKDNSKKRTINLIGSYEDSINIPGIKNKIASSAVIPKQKKGEVAELKSMLKL